ncbi:MAG TPA: NAD-dependent epimerase/dehydratase family protein [Polyangiaceae bacterium]|nr:NAD-dependent epimerase/dehydratase family protein [Polyangiaceae bacterium]
MLAWVTGATGFLGRALTTRLLARGDDVIALVRPSSRGRAPHGVRLVEGALPDVGRLASLPAPDLVFHCAAVIDCDDAEGRAVHADGTLRLSEAARGARFVHVSTTDVFAVSSSSPVTESTPCAPHDAYGRTKLEAERRLFSARPDAVVLRSPGIYGPGSTRDIVLHTAARIERGTFFLIGDGAAPRSWIFVETMVDALLHAAGRAELSGVYLVDDGRPVTRREIATAAARVLGRPPWFPRVPVAAARAAAWVAERALPPLGVRPPLTTPRVRYATTPLALDTARWKSTGFRTRYGLPDAVLQTITWGRAAGVLGR